MRMDWTMLRSFSPSLMSFQTLLVASLGWYSIDDSLRSSFSNPFFLIGP